MKESAATDSPPVRPGVQTERHRVRQLVDSVLSYALARAALLLRGSVAAVYIWFGVPKLFPGVSPAEALVDKTTSVLTFGLIEGCTACTLVGLFEVALAVLILSGRYRRTTLLLFLGHMAGTALPLLIFPDETWSAPLTATLEGQYIIKNIVLVTALITATATASRGAPHGAFVPRRP